MCKLSDKLMLCTCSPEALKTADYTWSYSHYEEPDSYIEGMYLPSHVSWCYENANVSGDEICRELNSRNCFDFELVPEERDILVFKFWNVRGRKQYAELTLNYRRGKWQPANNDYFANGYIRVQRGCVREPFAIEASDVYFKQRETLRAYELTAHYPVFKRALEYQTEGRVIGIARIATDTYAALVRGEKMYRVTMRIDTRHGIHSSCECPYYSDHRICKHVLAVSVEMRAYSDYVFSLPVDVEAAELQQSLKNAKASDLVAELKKLQTRMLAGEGANILPRLELILKLINPELLKEDFDIYNRVVYLYMRFTQLAALSGAVQRRIFDTFYWYEQRDSIEAAYVFAICAQVADSEDLKPYLKILYESTTNKIDEDTLPYLRRLMRGKKLTAQDVAWHVLRRLYARDRINESWEKPPPPVQCSACYHRIANTKTCAAFPKEIPDVLYRDEVQHIAAYPGDGGLSFEWDVG